MIVVTMICVGLTVWTRYQSDCDGIVLLNGKPAHSCSVYFWRENGSELEKYCGRSDSHGRYILRREGDGSRAPAGQYFMAGGTAFRANWDLWEQFQHHHKLREVTISDFGLVSHRIPDIDFAE